MPSLNKRVTIPQLEPFEIEYYISHNSLYKEPRIFPPHVHNAIEFYVHFEGDASFVVEQNLYRLQDGDIIVSRPNEIHNCILHSKSTHKSACFWFTVENDFLLKDFLQTDKDINHLISPPQQEKERLNELYKQFDQAVNDKDKRKAFSAAMQMLDIYLKNLRFDTPVQIMPDILRDILHDIHTNLPNILSLEYLLDKHYISPSTLTRQFKKYLHTSPKNYLDAKRLAYARILLQQGKSVSEASKLSGFSNPSNFIRLFKKFFDITPNQYKKH